MKKFSESLHELAEHVAKLEEVGLGIKVMVGADYEKYYADAHEKAKKYTEWALKMR